MPALALSLALVVPRVNPTPAASSFLLLETGDFFLLESGDKLIL
jgi:hypothetical protein